MKTRLCISTFLACVSSVPALSQALNPVAATASMLPRIPSKPASVAVQANYGKLPLSFEANQGQSDPQVKYLARGNGYSLYLTDSAAVLALTKGNPPSRKLDPRPAVGKTSKPEAPTAKTDVVRMELAGANPGLRVSGAEQLPGTANYFIGNDPAKWRPNVPTYAKVKYSGVYPGVDLVYYGNQRQLEYDFVLAPGANPKPVRLHFAGASKLTLNRDGDLTVTARNGEIAFHKPVVYQTKNGQREPLEGTFTLLANNTIGFTLGSYDHTRELVIDPTLAYSTYLGGSGFTRGAAIAVDGQGNAYVTAFVLGDFPTTEGAFQNVTTAGWSAFISKLNPAGSALIYSTYLVGSIGSSGSGIVVDHSGNVYVTGNTFDGNFPVTSGAYQTTASAGGLGTGFVTKLNASGSALLYSTYLGPSDGDNLDTLHPQRIAVDPDGNAYIAGFTASANYPVTAGAFQTVDHNATGTGFVTKLNPAGTALVYSTFLGGSSYDSINNIAIDGSGNAYVVGTTSSNDFPTTAGAYQETVPPFLSNQYGVFVSKLNTAGSALLYSTFLTGSGEGSAEGLTADQDLGIAIDDAGDAYVGGTTSSIHFPTTAGAFQTVNPAAGAGGGAGFVTKFNPSGSALVYSTYLGGSNFNENIYEVQFLNKMAVDSLGNAYLVGVTQSTDFPVTSDAFQKVNNGTGGPANVFANAFFTELNPSGSALVYSTYLGGSGLSYMMDIALNSLGNAYMTGAENANNFPVTVGAFQGQGNGGTSGFVSKFALYGATTTSLTSSDNPQTGGESVTFSAHVAPVEGTGVPAGIVSFIVDGVITDHETLDGSGDASFSTSTLTVGPHTIVARYDGQPTVYSGGSGAPLTQTITGQVSAPTFNPPGGTFSSLSFVVLETASPGATIYYTTGSTTPTTSSTKYTAPIMISGTTTINAIAVESGDTQSPVATATFTILPTAIATTTTLQSSLNPSTAGQSVTFTATVTAASGPTPTGSVIFKHGSTIMGSAPLVAGIAQFTTSSLTSEAYEVLAVYTGSSTDANSHSPAVLEFVYSQ
jgi:hypothetical protein